MDDFAIKVDKVDKVFKLPHEKNTSVKSALINFYRRNRSFEMQKVLQDISFGVKKGEFFGIVGRNGSGKSTLLKLIAGIYTPTKGAVTIEGKLTPFIELGVGFNPELTGRENVFLNGALLGFNRREMLAMYEDIVEFAELEKFMDQKLKNYSSGMQVRLAFSIAIRAQGDILVLDEVLAVGDAIFQKKCFNYFKQLKKNKKTVILVSHDTNTLEEYCENGILIEGGKIIKQGKIKTVVNNYIDILNKKEELASENKSGHEARKERWGTGAIQVKSIKIIDSTTLDEKSLFTENDEMIGIKVNFKAVEKKESPIYGVTITDVSGQRIFQSNTMWKKLQTTTISGGEEVEVYWEVPNFFNTGDFYISPAAADKHGTVIYDWRDELGKFKIRKRLTATGFINVQHLLQVSKPQRSQ